MKNSKFAPRGIRGCGSPFTHQIFAVKEGEYEVTCDDNLLTIVQIESTDGVTNVQAIAEVDGVDILFVGPFDLAKSMDVEFGGQEHEKAIAGVLEAAHKAGKKAAIFCKPLPLLCFAAHKHSPGVWRRYNPKCGSPIGVSGDKAKKRLDQGFDMVSCLTDTDAMIWEVTRQVDVARS